MEKQIADPLIRTKLHVPPARPGVILRARLQDQISQGLRGRLTLVIAPAGFGKTTLVTASAAACCLPLAWLSLDRGDNQAGRFLTYLIAAFQSVDERVGGEAALLMKGMQPAPAEAVLTSLVNDLDTAQREMVLVLDDYQFIRSAEVHAAVAFLLEHSPDRFHLLIVSRSDPALPVARLRARSQLVELRGADLRFTAVEAAQFLNGVMGLSLDPELVAALEARTEGWVAGLQMAALSLQGREDVHGFITGFSGTNRHILDYLMEEILAGQPAEIQRFLRYTSVLERLTAPLCDAVTEIRDWGLENGDPSLRPAFDSRMIMEQLERANLFLTPLDDERIWFRYHHLFSDLLQAQLIQTQPELVPLLHLRAAAWLERNGLIPEAIQHHIAAQQEDKAADLIERYGPARWAESDASIVQLADGLSREILIARPKLGISLAWLFINQGAIEKAIPLLAELAQQLASGNLNPGERWIQTMVSVALAFLLPPGGAPGMDPLPDYPALEEIPAGELVLRDAADLLYGMALGRRGEIDRAAEVALMCIQRETASRGKAYVPGLVPFLAFLYNQQGRLHAAASLCREYLDPIRNQDIRFITAPGSLNVVLGEVLYEWNHLEEAEQQIREGLRANQPWQNIMPDGLGLFVLACILQARGDTDGAMQAVAKFEDRLHGEPRPVEFQGLYRTLRVNMQLVNGDLQNASQWAEQVSHEEDFPLHEEDFRFTLARIHLAQGRYAEVEKLLVGRTDPLIPGNRVAGKIELNVLLAAALAAQRRLPEALDLVAASLALAEPEGYLRTFLDLGEAVRSLLETYRSDPTRANRDYAQKILEASGPANAATPEARPGGLVEDLTPRELDVLGLLAQGCTNRQIAEKLFLSEGTVKFYVHAVIEKLGVHSRTQAILAARERNLV